MKNFRIFLLITTLSTFKLVAQEMTPNKLKQLITQVADTIKTNGNSIQFAYKETMLIYVFDENTNRMRIITPVAKKEDLGQDELLNALVANFHSALDVKYALSDELIWSVFIHPLREPSDHQVLYAIDQVYSAAVTLGTSYSSTNLVFPGNTKKKENQKKTFRKTKI